MFYIYVDTFSVTELTEDLDPPTNLAATVSGNDVHLTWVAPGTPTPGTWLHYDSGENDDSIGTGAAADFDVAIRYPGSALTEYVGSSLHALKLWPSQAGTFSARVWTGGTPTAAGTMVIDQAFTPVLDTYNTVVLNTPVPITGTQELWFGYRCNVTSGYPAGCDAGPAIDGFGNMMYFQGAWSTLLDLAPTLNYNWNIQGYVGMAPPANAPMISMPAIANNLSIEARGITTGTLASAGVHKMHNTAIDTPDTGDYNRDLLGYKVYRDGTLINTIQGGATVSYDDNDLAIGTYSYTVTANYDGGESVPVGPVSATITPVLDPPVDLTAVVDGSNVHLDWMEPGTAVSAWIHYDSGENDDSIGTGAAADFDVAIRFPGSALTDYVGNSLYALKLWPAQAGTFSARVWTGGTPTVPGTMVIDQAFTPTLDVYNTVVLNTPVPITGTQELWFGYRCNVTSGYPAGCDAGPAIDGFGNMMYFQGAWQTLLELAPSLNYNWNIQGWVGQGAPANAPAISMPVFANSYSSEDRGITTGTLASTGVHKMHNAPARTAKADVPAVYNTVNHNRNLLGYKVYRDGALISTITGPTTTAYDDNGLASGTYSYTVTANYTEGESAPAGPVQVTIAPPLPPAFFTDDFEAYPDFNLTFAPWTLLDVDQSATYGIQDVSFPNSESPMAYIIFNPAATTPAITSIQAHSGAKMAASFASVTPPNNDWMVTPRVHLGTNSAVKFWARSHTAQYGLERFRVGVSLLPSVVPQGFQYVSGTEFVEAPTTWTEYTYDLSTYDNQNVYIGIRCVSNDAFVFYVDDFAIHSNGGSDGEDQLAPVAFTELKGNYPNPFNPETTISYSVKENLPVNIEIYNLKGQKVKSLVKETKAAGNYKVAWNGTDDNNRPVSSGVYFFKMNAGKYSSTKKMIMMK
ncbi:MAG: T9SS type A sorting domain-containing protein [Candidatus Cloacimonetes bacterium]|nr:T9SS type A sorting domain-containing protein [Candidatus Cloacimonadota bacterium]